MKNGAVMNQDILITKQADFPTAVYEITVQDAASQTVHMVTIDRAYHHKLTEGIEISAERLLEQSFRFLLEREPKESILAEFDLSEIERYFSEYQSVIRQQLSDSSM